MNASKESVRFFLIGLCTRLIIPNLSKPQAGIDGLDDQSFGENYVASGAMNDPDPIVNFEEKSMQFTI